MSTDDGFGRRWGRNGELCVAVGPATRTGGILAYCMLAQLGRTLAGSKIKGDELPRDGPHGLCVNLFSIREHDMMTVGNVLLYAIGKCINSAPSS